MLLAHAPSWIWYCRDLPFYSFSKDLLNSLSAACGSSTHCQPPSTGLSCRPLASCGPCGLALPSWSLPIAPENATFPTPQPGAYRPHPTSPSLLFLICTMGTAGLASQWDCEVLGRGQKTINPAACRASQPRIRGWFQGVFGPLQLKAKSQEALQYSSQ